MSREKQYLVKGKYQNIDVEIVELAYSSRQAKEKAAFHYGFFGPDVSSWMNSKKIRVRRF